MDNSNSPNTANPTENVKLNDGKEEDIEMVSGTSDDGIKNSTPQPSTPKVLWRTPALNRGKGIKRAKKKSPVLDDVSKDFMRAVEKIIAKCEHLTTIAETNKDLDENMRGTIDELDSWARTAKRLKGNICYQPEMRKASSSSISSLISLFQEDVPTETIGNMAEISNLRETIEIQKKQIKDQEDEAEEIVRKQNQQIKELQETAQQLYEKSRTCNNCKKKITEEEMRIEKTKEQLQHVNNLTDSEMKELIRSRCRWTESLYQKTTITVGKAGVHLSRRDFKTIIVRDIDTTITKQELTEELKKATGDCSIESEAQLRRFFANCICTSAPTAGDKTAPVNWLYPEIDPNSVPPFTLEDLVDVADRMKCKKAPGPNGILPEIVKCAVKAVPNYILEVMNSILLRGDFPSRWKKARVVLLPKPGKPAFQPSSYRPLCLLDTFGKLLEGLLIKRMMEELGDHGLSDDQFGFRPGRSTVDAIQRVYSIADDERKKSRRRRGLCLLVTLDVRNAFNLAPWREIIDSLERKNVPVYMVKTFMAYFHDRWIFTTNGTPIKTSAGVPQGSVASPTLWNLLYDGVLELELPRGVSLVAYADDLAVVTVARTAPELEESANRALGCISNWMTSHGLALAPEKSEAVLLIGRKTCGPVQFHINGTQIQLSVTDGQEN
ncbi:hypothetical protein WDU94_010715 [Cyamophila willieti]